MLLRIHVRRRYKRNRIGKCLYDEIIVRQKNEHRDLIQCQSHSRIRFFQAQALKRSVCPAKTGLQACAGTHFFKKNQKKACLSDELVLNIYPGNLIPFFYGPARYCGINSRHRNAGTRGRGDILPLIAKTGCGDWLLIFHGVRPGVLFNQPGLNVGRVIIGLSLNRNTGSQSTVVPNS